MTSVQYEAFRIAFLPSTTPRSRRHHLPFHNLGTLGIEATLRLVDPGVSSTRRLRRLSNVDMIIRALRRLDRSRRLLAPYFSPPSLGRPRLQ